MAIKIEIQKERTEFEKGKDKGYQLGRNYYKNDVHMEVADIGTTIDVLERYEPEEVELIKRLKHTKEVLEILLETKAKSKKFL